MSYWEYVEKCEGPQIWDYLHDVWETMKSSVERGLQAEGVLPGPIHLQRKAAAYHIKARGYTASLHGRGLVFAYALAVSEENASGGVIVTAPTCGSCGVVPGMLYHLWKSRDFNEMRILRALATAGLIGNIAKHTASISGAEAGCQAEVGAASAMAASAIVEIMGGTPEMCLDAASFALSNLLGLVCDPIAGLVEAPCQSRNAIGVANAITSAELVLSGVTHHIPFDEIAHAMLRVGKSLPFELRETAMGGCAGTPTGCALGCNICK
jgi:L-serine dehydratase